MISDFSQNFLSICGKLETRTERLNFSFLFQTLLFQEKNSHDV